MPRPPFKPLDKEAAAVREGEQRWLYWQHQDEAMLASRHVDDRSALNRLGDAAAKFGQALQEFVGQPTSGHMASLLAAMQELDQPWKSQTMQRARMDRLHTEAELVAHACEKVAPGPGGQVNARESRFVWCVADAWVRLVGEDPTPAGRFYKAILACAEAPVLRDITTDRVRTALERWKKDRAFWRDHSMNNSPSE